MSQPMEFVDHKRIAKNTLLLYARMGLIMIISLWSSRVVLQSLGVVDFGLYNVIAGIVVAFSFMSGALNSSCNRYYSTELGKDSNGSITEVYKANLSLFLLLSLIVLLLCESLGLFLLERKMNIPAERHEAAGWVFQFSIITFLSSLIAIPFKSLITAKEKMKVYAYSSIIEAALKLAICYLLDKSPVDKLVFYALLLMLVSILTNLFYILYCKHFYPECNFSGRVDKALVKEILAFNGWAFIGSAATVAKNQGVNILLNMFFGPVVNAARGIANQVYVNVYQFVQNYTLAFSPQIVKSWSAGQRKACLNLIYRSSRLSYLLLFMIVLPLISELDLVLRLWLVEVPEHSLAFARLMLLTALVDSLHTPLYNGIQASGKVKWLNILVGGCQLGVVLLSYIILKCFKIAPEYVFVFILSGAILSQIIRIILSVKEIELKFGTYLRTVLLPVCLVSILATGAETVLLHLLPQGWLRLTLSILSSLLIVGGSMLYFRKKEANYD